MNDEIIQTEILKLKVALQILKLKMELPNQESPPNNVSFSERILAPKQRRHHVFVMVTTHHGLD